MKSTLEPEDVRPRRHDLVRREISWP
jgi:hypothetical protein